MNRTFNYLLATILCFSSIPASAMACMDMIGSEEDSSASEMISSCHAQVQDQAVKSKENNTKDLSHKHNCCDDSCFTCMHMQANVEIDVEAMLLNMPSLIDSSHSNFISVLYKLPLPPPIV